jgi:hypothetical protein
VAIILRNDIIKLNQIQQSETARWVLKANANVRQRDCKVGGPTVRKNGKVRGMGNTYNDRAFKNIFVPEPNDAVAVASGRRTTLSKTPVDGLSTMPIAWVHHIDVRHDSYHII